MVTETMKLKRAYFSLPRQDKTYYTISKSADLRLDGLLSLKACLRRRDTILLLIYVLRLEQGYTKGRIDSEMVLTRSLKEYFNAKSCHRELTRRMVFEAVHLTESGVIRPLSSRCIRTSGSGGACNSMSKPYVLREFCSTLKQMTFSRICERSS